MYLLLLPEWWVIPFDMRQTWKRQTYISTINRIMRRKATVTGGTCSNGGFRITGGYDGTLHTIGYTVQAS